MDVASSIKTAVARLLPRTGYPLLVRKAVNLLPVKTNITAHSSASISRGTRFGGEISIGEEAIIESNCTVRGDVTIGRSARIGPNTLLEGDVRIGKGTNFVQRGEVIGEVRLGKYNAIARRTTFEARNHDMHKPGIQMRFYENEVGEPLDHVSNGPIVVGSDVWFGADVTVLSDVEIGSGAVIGARSVVTDDVPPYAIMAGVPAEQIGWRFAEETRSQLLEIEWWEWSEDKINRNSDFFTMDIREVDEIRDYVV